MKLRLAYALLATITLASSLRAQRPADDEDEDFTDLGYYANAKNTLTFGFRAVQGAKVHFGNLGTVPSIRTLEDVTSTNSRTYDNGAVIVDSPTARTSETAATSAAQPNGRYYTYVLDPTTGEQVKDADGQPIQNGDFLSYAPGLTRSWSFRNNDQVLPDGSGIRFSNYSAVSEGAQIDGKKQLSNGIELQLSRQLRKIG